LASTLWKEHDRDRTIEILERKEMLSLSWRSVPGCEGQKKSGSAAADLLQSLQAE
jgi:hypothetical protein